MPTRNCRYSSLSVGARKPQPRSPHTPSQLAIWYRAARAWADDGVVAIREVRFVVGGRRAARVVDFEVVGVVVAPAVDAGADRQRQVARSA